MRRRRCAGHHVPAGFDRVNLFHGVVRRTSNATGPRPAVSQSGSPSSRRFLRFCLGAGFVGPNAQPVDEDVDETQDAGLPARLIVHVAHAH